MKIQIIKISIILMGIYIIITGMINNANAACEKAEILYEQALDQENIAQRIDLLNESLKECRNFDAFYELAMAYEADKNYKLAEEALLGAANTTENNKALAKVFARLGAIYEQMNKKTQALNCFRESYKRFPYPQILQKMKILTSLQMGEPVSADDIKKSLIGLSKGFGVEPVIDIYINFETNKAELSIKGRKQADHLGIALADPVFKNQTFILIGHTDSRGRDEYNQELSEKRADSVKTYLVSRFQLNPRQIKTQGKGESEPRFPEHTEHDYALNRRVEVRLADNKTP
ncbi:OmpA-like domain-containing protein [Desulfonema limicola]|uniref:OmpA-like domain-containing protein n=1 Tax=Desulfonema limicola TaxID=45656 RepID=A0A975GFV1_9BACT|nr:OmpA family protein [Desulfonema limicola]QTA79647.1 OmpA-like domain-containing protein [Desulfonema limicola]